MAYLVIHCGYSPAFMRLFSIKSLKKELSEKLTVTPWRDRRFSDMLLGE